VTRLLDGVRVVEIGVLLAVDHLGGLLGDEGADVIKVESPQLGDYLRNIGPVLAKDWSIAHLGINRNKRSVTIDGRTSRGQELLTRLVKTADVLITGNVGETNRKLGLDYHAVARINPELVYCQVTGFGASGPYAEVPTHGNMMDALGAESPTLSVDEHGVVRAAPPDAMQTPGSGGVVLGPMYAAFAVAAGLCSRHRTGRGCYIDISCAESVLGAQRTAAIGQLNPEKISPDAPMGDLTNSAKYQHYQTSDGKYILFCCIEPKFWDNFCRAAGRHDLLDRHDRSVAADFGFDDDDLRHELQESFRTRTQAEWMAVASEHHVPMGPALRFDQLADDPHLQARSELVREDHPLLGSFLTLGSPVSVPGQEMPLRSAPAHGADTDEVLSELGIGPAEVEALREEGVI
jgi:crotonobetainyl-CoA:carnitine CoA-transferase CaiB-like acyl-CoA transferase